MLLECRKNIPLEPQKSATQKTIISMSAINQNEWFLVTVTNPMVAVLNPLEMQTSKSRCLIICYFRNVEFV